MTNTSAVNEPLRREIELKNLANTWKMRFCITVAIVIADCLISLLMIGVLNDFNESLALIFVVTWGLGITVGPLATIFCGIKWATSSRSANEFANNRILYGN